MAYSVRWALALPYHHGLYMTRNYVSMLYLARYSASILGARGTLIFRSFGS
jgi:hypothetical protein